MDTNIDEYFVEEKSGFDKLIDFLVFLAVFAVTIFLILEILAQSGRTSLDIMRINEIYYYVNIVVFVIFAVDLVRLWRESDGVSDFFKHNWLDVLATIPFGLIAQVGPRFEILKWTKLAKLTYATKLQKVSRVSKVSKEFKAASHLKKESDDYKKKHRL